MMIDNTDIPQISSLMQLAKDSVVMAALVVIMVLGLIVYKQIIKPISDQRALIAAKEAETSVNQLRASESLERTADKLEIITARLTTVHEQLNGHLDRATRDKHT